MQKRKLGNSGLEVAPLAFGGNVFGWTADEATSFRLLDAFVDAGFNLIDTADIYSNWVAGNKGGESESIIGKWLKQSGKRDKVLIATKVGMQTSTGEKGLSREHIRKSIDGSLQRLGIDSIDLYQAHQDDPDTPLEETLGAFAELMREGKVRAIGASNYSAARLSEALATSRQHGLPRYESMQPQYNLYDRQGFEAELEPLCLREHVGVISYYSLASGFLTGKYRSKADLGSRARSGTVKGYLNDRGQKILKALDEVAGRLSTSPAQVALAWLIARPSITAPIASATSLEQLSELTAAARLQLDGHAVEALNHASA